MNLDSARRGRHSIGMAIFETLAEARIRDWQRRGRPHAETAVQDLGAGTLEGQLLSEIIALLESARDESDAGVREHLRDEARKRRIQLMVLLEKSGRALAAKAIEERLAALVD